MTPEEQMQNLRDWLSLYSARQEEAETRHNREIAEIRELQAIGERETAAIRKSLRRAVRLGVREALNERKRRHELDQRRQDLAAHADHRHQELEKLMERFFERGGNGHN